MVSPVLEELSPASLSAALAEALAGPTGPAAGAAPGGSLLHAVSRRPTFGRLLDAVLAEEPFAEQVAARSYRHALGFDKLILASAAPLGQLRLHVWWPDEVRGREHVHNHRFPFSSVLVAGRLRTYLHHLSDGGVPMVHFRETSDVADRRWRFDRVGDARVAAGLVADLPAGAAYTMSADLLHRVEASPLLTATLFLETHQRRAWSSVYVDSGAEAPSAHDQTVFTVQELRDRLAVLRAAVAALPPG
jgi:hypothetical protein